ncbi:MGDG synthase family glycosyltransferase [Halobacillus seohaensis]|uniref:Glycosyltransferase n=1 Tax=Halobacillus seohaensis TaxID=447421 RepID=A0ABW2EL38_9BACI
MKQTSKSILFLPFLQIPSGHHQVADALIEALSQKNCDYKCEKIDILSHSYGKVESMVSSFYLKWIQSLPALYNRIYQDSVNKNIEENKRYRLYEGLFLNFMRKLLKEKQPDLIVCTHALPSYMLNFLKENHELNIPVINVYTDYFIHRLWGVQNIDFHLVPSHHMQELLIRKGVKEDQIFITGIPIHNKIQKISKEYSKTLKPSFFSFLITGGSMGVGSMESLVEKIAKKENVDLYVLCGKNKDLFHKLKKMNKENITPLQYIDCRKKMNELYDHVDVILTKPGGVTISESLFKRKPIFVYYALPGQEEINLKQLKKLGIIFDLNNTSNENKGLDERLFSILENNRKLDEIQHCMSEYHKHITGEEPFEIIEGILLKTKR